MDKKELITKIAALLEAKFQGVRKDGLAVAAQIFGLTCNTEDDAKKLVESLSMDDIKAFVTDYRKGIDKEITTATDTRERTLREKFNFVEKKQEPTPPAPPTPGAPTSAEDIARIINEAVIKATEPLTQRIAAMEQGKVTTSRRDMLTQAFGNDIPDTIKQSMLRDFENMSFKDDEAFNTYLTAKKADIAQLSKEIAESGLGNHHAPQFGNVDSSGVSEVVKSFIETASKGSESSVGKEFQTK